MKNHKTLLGHLQLLNTHFLLFILLGLSILSTAQQDSGLLRVEVNGEPVSQIMLKDKNTLIDIDGTPMEWVMDEGPIFIRIDNEISIREATVHSPGNARCFFYLFVVYHTDNMSAYNLNRVSTSPDDLAPLVDLGNRVYAGTRKSPVFGHGGNMRSTLSFANDNHSYNLLICYPAEDDDVVILLQQLNDGVSFRQGLDIVNLKADENYYLALTDVVPILYLMQASIMESPDQAITCVLYQDYITGGKSVIIRVDQPSRNRMSTVDHVSCWIEKRELSED